MNFLHIFDDREMMQFFVVFIKATMVILCLGLVENGAEGRGGYAEIFFSYGLSLATTALISVECPLMTLGAH